MKCRGRLRHSHLFVSGRLSRHFRLRRESDPCSCVIIEPNGRLCCLSYSWVENMLLKNLTISSISRKKVVSGLMSQPLQSPKTLSVFMSSTSYGKLPGIPLSALTHSLSLWLNMRNAAQQSSCLLSKVWNGLEKCGVAPLSSVMLSKIIWLPSVVSSF